MNYVIMDVVNKWEITYKEGDALLSDNNIRSVGIHLFVLVMCGMLYFLHATPIGVLPFTIVAYIALGYVFLQPLKSMLANLLSVTAVSIIGLFIGLYVLTFPSKMGFNWFFFLFYNLHAITFSEAFHFSLDPSITFWQFILPTVWLWIGLQLKHIVARVQNRRLKDSEATSSSKLL
ncbi:hypothetical protein PaecuDRAFT_2548 [Paenibacillus curdlanolyticus YK9]|uniref:Uncharacterized protein n=1 Tax=Paenibacillus curdlanolyticus YK9 TaxID=717606 RepID=E0IA59_9BACL|nr:hypothetical protein PaecuDRAFT_2548 [Paenibacillus curdlanolyticus YK9]